MKKWTLLLTSAVVALTSAVALAQQAAPADVPKELAPYQGTWIVDQISGNSVPFEMALVIDGARYAQTVDGTVNETGQIKIDATKTPHHVTLVIEEGDDAGQTQLGIIEVKDGVVRCLLNAPGDGNRPTSLDKGDGELYVVAHKKK